MNFRDEAINAMAIAIAKMEGFENPESRARRNHNPGNLIGWNHRLAEDKQGFTIFANDGLGWQALKEQISKTWLWRDAAGQWMTWLEFFAGQRLENGKVRLGGYYGYAPAGHGSNDPQHYAEYVLGELNKRFGTTWKLDDACEKCVHGKSA